VRFRKDKNGLTLARLTLASGTSTEIYLHGAHVANFVTETGRDVFFMSSKAIFNESKPIRGGIPVIFPQFGPGKLPQHGFARTSNNWVVRETLSTSPFEATIKLELKDTPESRKLWDHAFLAIITVTITYNEVDKSRFFQSFSVTNLNNTTVAASPNANQPFDFTTALHTYFSVADIHQTTVTPMKDLTYNDKPTNTVQRQVDDAVQFSGETDRVYHNAPDKLVIHTPTHNVVVIKTNFMDAVLWNAWSDLSKTIADLGPDEWKGYVCCEVGTIANPVTLTPGQTWQGCHTIYLEHVAHANV